MQFDWQQLEDAWFEAALCGLRSTIATKPDARLAAGAFWLLHGDYSSILCPAFGLSAEDEDEEVRWHPPDWRWAVVDEAVDRVKGVYGPLQGLDVDDATFEALWEAHVDCLAAVCRRVTTAVRATPPPVDASALAREFFVGIIDFAQGDAGGDYLRRSVDAKTIAALGVLDGPNGAGSC